LPSFQNLLFFQVSYDLNNGRNVHRYMKFTHQISCRIKG
jgi:hypothetical protein